MTLQAEVQVQLGSLRLDVRLDAEPGEVVALLGPNGAGKTSLLRCLAGLLPIDAGRISLDGSVLDEPGANVFIPAERRSVSVVFQNYLLFEHLSALDNIAFGLRARGANKAEARRTAADWLARVGLDGHDDHKPRALSGGQQQRVALARALATHPSLLLLDEPLAALDASARNEVRRDLRGHLSSFDGIRILVTHDPIDAYALADRIVVLQDGEITQAGTLDEVTAHPRSQYVAELAGTTLVSGTLVGNRLTLPTGATLFVAEEGSGATNAAIHPNAVALYRTPPDGSPRNVWEATVADVDTYLQRVRVRLGGPIGIIAEITPAALHDLGLRPGDTVWASVKATDITTYPA